MEKKMDYSEQMRDGKVIILGFCGGNIADHPQLAWFKEAGGEIPRKGSFVVFRFPDSTDFSWKNMNSKNGWKVNFKDQSVIVRGCTGNAKNIVTLNGEGDFRIYIVPSNMEKRISLNLKKDIKRSVGKSPMIIQFE
jgi:hypothetical protein